MCGILGWFAPGKGVVDSKIFKRALLCMSHRGPDDMGIYEDNGICLGHVRLAVIDPYNGHQPLVDTESGVVLNYNGEFYNYIEERKILESKGHCFKSHCDTEVLLHMYLEYGTKMLERINGMFAFTIYDPHSRSLFCARDHIGIKPFYYQNKNGIFVFASEIKGIVALGGTFEAEPEAIPDYIYLQYVMGEKTFFRNVFRLMPGECMRVFADGTISKSTYWAIDPSVTFEGNFDEAAGRLHELLDQSIRLQLRSDVPIGAHLSGGLDTGSVCSLAAKHISPKRLHTFTAGFQEGGIFDDSKAASISSRFVGTEHYTEFPTYKDFEELYPKIVWYLDEPMAAQGVFPQYIVSRLAKKKVTVVLGGQGADEIMGGYTRYYILLLDQAIRNGAGRGNVNLGIQWNELGESLGQMHNYAPLWSKMQAGGAFEEPELRYWRMIDRSEDLKDSLTEDFVSSLHGYSPYDTYREYLNRFSDVELLNRILYFEASCWLQALLHVEDRMSMAVSIESRVPILDPELIRFVFSLPTRIKMKNGLTKAIMRAAFANDLALEIRDRRDKFGFPVPTSRWFAGPLKNFISDHLTSHENLKRGIFKKSAILSAVDSKQGDHDRSLWGMLNIELWHNNLKT